jgi:DNA-binding transcriptional ArsR family regulator
MDKHPQKIPSDLAARLEDATLQALQHPHRRLILRALESAGRGMSSAELVRTDRVCLSVSNVSYHVRTLSECGLLVEVGQEVLTRGNVETWFASQINDNSVVLEVLRVTETSDEILSPTLDT